MFSAVKLVVAGGIVALFGGFLMMGMLATPQGDGLNPAAVTNLSSPMTTEDLLSGTVTEEIDAGVFRVVNDGVRPVGRSIAVGDLRSIRLGPDETPWLFGEDGFHRLGEAGAHRWPGGDDHGRNDPDVEVGPDGTVWAGGLNGTVHAFDGVTWRDWSGFEAGGEAVVSPDANLEVLDDGTVWLEWPLRNTLYRFDGSDWDAIEPPSDDAWALRAAGNDVWVDGDFESPDGGDLYRWDGSAWQVVDTPAGYRGRGGFNGSSPVGDDGTLWVEYQREPDLARTDGYERSGIARFDGTGWQEWDAAAFEGEEADGPRRSFLGYFDFEAIAPDGSLWGSVGEWGGLARFDGQTVTRYLEGQRIGTVAAAADGSVWVIAQEPLARDGEDGALTGLYLITPEAVAAKEGEAREPPSVKEAKGAENPATADILPGVELTVEEVERGVLRVDDDGVRSLAPGRNTDIVAGHDGGIWLLQNKRLIRLGSDVEHAWPAAGGLYRVHFQVASDGTAWVIQTDRSPEETSLNPSGTLFSLDSDGWTRAKSPPGRVFTVVAAPDGTLWASWTDGDFSGVGHLGANGWVPLVNQGIIGQHVEAARLYVTDSGDLYAEDCGFVGCWFDRYGDGAWEMFIEHGGLFDVSSDGTVWFLGPLGGIAADAPQHGLARFADGEWEWWELDDLPDMGLSRGRAALGLVYTFDAAPDGSLWASVWRSDDVGTGSQERRAACDGLVRFDGQTIDHYLRGRCVTKDIAADGTVWVLADEEEGKGLYVIAPEAVAASDQ